MLYHYRGLLTDERFSSMTLVQWIFYYVMIIREEKDMNKSSFDMTSSAVDAILKTHVSMTEAILNYINPERFRNAKMESDLEKDTEGLESLNEAYDRLFSEDESGERKIDLEPINVEIIREGADASPIKKKKAVLGIQRRK